MKLSKEDIIKLAKENYKYIISIVALVVVIIVLATCTSNSSKNTEKTTGDIVAVENQENISANKNDNAFKQDAYPEVNELVNKYFSAAAAGDIETLKTIIWPFDENQQNLISQLSQYIESYNNISCYTKIGPVKDSYFVSVYHDTKFVDIETLAPGVTTLYIHRDETSGALYIDNRPQEELEPEVIAFNQDYIHAEDVVELKNSVDAKAQEVLVADEKLKSFVEGTYQQIYVNFYAAIQKANEQTQAEQNADTPADTPEQNAETPANGATTVYATDMVNIRKEPDTNAEIIGMTDFGSSYTLVENMADGWTKIDMDGAIGYIKSEFLSETSPDSNAQGNGETAGNNGSIAAGDSIYLLTTVNVRAAADENSEKLGVAYEGETIKVVTADENGWTKINWNGKEGYVKTEFLK